MEQTMTVAKDAARQVSEHPNLKLLVEPTLSIVAFERVGWSSADYEKWSDKLLADQIGFVTPSAHKGKPILRFAIVNHLDKRVRYFRNSRHALRQKPTFVSGIF